jgi:cyclomaltodextrinase / maltogenic alpha-amylase / neopullulanase
MAEIKLGKYRHFKGKFYKVIGIAKHSETIEDFVVYKPLYKSDTKLWIRPKKMFTETVLFNGKPLPRFKFMEKK